MTRVAPAALALLALACSSSGSDQAGKSQVTSRGLAARLVFAVELPAHANRDAVLDQALETVRQRVDALGLREPAVFKRDDRIVVEFLDANVDLVERARNAIARRGSLRFRLAVHGHSGMLALCRAAERDAADAGPAVTAGYDSWQGGDAARVTSDCYLQAADRAVLEAHLQAHAAELALGTDQELVYEELPPRDGAGESTWRTHVINRTSVLTGAHVKNVYVAQNPQINAPEVRLELDRDGTQLFALITRENIGTKLVMTLDDRVLSAPVIHGEVTAGEAVINLGAVDPSRAQAEAQDLALAIRAGSLPAPLRLESAIGF